MHSSPAVLRRHRLELAAAPAAYPTNVSPLDLESWWVEVGVQETYIH